MLDVASPGEGENPMNNELRFGLIGAGRIGPVHAESLAFRVPQARLVAIADLKQPAAQAVASRCNVPKIVSSGAEIIADPAIDAVAICSPTDTHADLIVAAAKAGKHIFCEKPLAANLADAQMEALGFPRDWQRRGRHYRAPSESSFFRLLSHLQSRELERALLDWQDVVLGKRDSHGDEVALDGKELLSSQGMEIASAYSLKDGRWLGSEPVAQGSNEIPAVQELLRRADIEGALVTADALNTQTQTARIIVQERGADYLLPLKGNQKGVCATVQQLYQGLSDAFSP